ncbi:fimbrial protein [Proteus vulgaris]|uniref:fimbrial protein n=1 Tax=Proteus vulgaris TaxID=585 RepID=UPI0018E45C4E|nr:fimbrial protein [Proteus vulgaris]MBI6531170.1 fimbrial protein [Proteus vulgaris]
MFRKSLFLILSLFSTYAYSGHYNNSIIFIENNIDNEFFIAPRKVDPRFSGANVFTKYNLDKQDSLGYMGYGSDGASAKKGGYLDIWLDDSTIKTPFLGQRCKKDDSSCPSDGILKADYLFDNGAYHIPITTTGGGANIPRGIFSDSIYQFIKQLPISSMHTFNYSFCSTMDDYNPKNGQTCQSVGGKTGGHIFDITKDGHLTLKSTNALQEIFVDSNGNAVLGLGSQFCENAIVDKKQGIMCSLVAYNYEGTFKNYSIRISLKLHSILDSISSKAKNSLLIGDGNNSWVSGTSAINIDKVITNGDGDIFIFMGQDFLKEIISNQIDLAKSQELFTFFIDNTRLSQSGYYEFTPSNTIIIKPRDYGISIVSKELVSNPHKEGKVGDKEPPLTFDYIVTTSAFRQANKITASVEGPKTIVRGQPYCLFSSKDKKMNVPFSAYLTYTDEGGSKVKTRTACDNEPISIKEALWTQTTWPYPYQLEGYFYRTDLQLTFPMNESTSLFSMEGEDWIGVVEASGYVNVFAEWSGPDIH